MDLVVARIGKAHGLRGDVVLDVRTDVPELRFTIGARFATDSAVVPALVIEAIRRDGPRFIARFEGTADRTEAEKLRGLALLVRAQEGEETDAWYPHELAGLEVFLHDGAKVGTVVGLVDSPAQDLLVIEEPDGTKVMLPFVRQLVPEVDTAAGRIVIDPPGGLFQVRGEE